MYHKVHKMQKNFASCRILSVLKAVEEDADVEAGTVSEVVLRPGGVEEPVGFHFRTRLSLGVRETSMPRKGATAMKAYLCMAA